MLHLHMVDFPIFLLFMTVIYVMFGWLTFYIMLECETKFESLLLFFVILCFGYLMIDIDILVLTKDENIDNHRYISTWMLRIYWIYQRYIDKYFETKYWWTKN